MLNQSQDREGLQRVIHDDDDGGEESPLIQYRNDGNEEEILQEREDHDDVGRFHCNNQ